MLLLSLLYVTVCYYVTVSLKKYVTIYNRKRDDYIMASMTSPININVDKKIKEEATNILKGLGLNMSTFIFC